MLYVHIFCILQDVPISEEEMDYMMDLRPYITPNPYTIEPVSKKISSSFHFNSFS